MRILLFGASGPLGQELRRSLSNCGEVVVTQREAEGALFADFLQPDSVSAVVRSVRPEVIVNAASFSAVDLAEADQDTARRVNAEAPALLAREAEALDAWMIHYSSDYVFDGSGKQPWNESSPTAPLNVYGRTKRESEIRVLEACRRSLVFRIGWLYGAHGRNFIADILRLARSGEHIGVVDDQIGAPTSATLVAAVTAHAVRAAVCDDSLANLYHLCAAGETSRYDHACRILEHAFELGALADRRQCEVERLSSAASPRKARRPLNSRLDTTRLRNAFGLTLPSWTTESDQVLTKLLARADS
jgi:dTDP-4-dehydrorhamnose reductase